MNDQKSRIGYSILAATNVALAVFLLWGLLAKPAPPPKPVISAEPCCFNGKAFLRIDGLMSDGTVVWMPTKAKYCWEEATVCEP